jgi:molybdopterin-biosynthesis enzyme MoeA-like protein
MLKKFEEYINEGLISDFEKKQEEVSSKILLDESKQFILDFLRKMNKVGCSCSVIVELNDKNIVIYTGTPEGIPEMWEKFKSDSIENISDEQFLKSVIRRKDLVEFEESDSTRKNKLLNRSIIKWFKERFDTWSNEHTEKKRYGDGKVKTVPYSNMCVGFLLDNKDDIIDEIF